jgi:hypothetical protein
MKTDIGFRTGGGNNSVFLDILEKNGVFLKFFKKKSRFLPPPRAPPPPSWKIFALPWKQMKGEETKLRKQ